MTRGFKYTLTLGAAVMVVTLGSGALAIGVVRHEKANAAALNQAGGATSSPPSTSPAASPSPSPSPSRTASAGIYAQVAAVLKSRGTHAAAGIVDLDTGEKVMYNPSVKFETASIVKVDILSSLMWKLQKANSHLSSSQRALATKMITQSDNNAASALWTQIGKGTGLAAANRAFGLTTTIPGTGGQWGLTKTTVPDQLRLLTILSSAVSPLSATSKAYILGLMNQVEKDQRWGVPHAADDEATAVYVKNGWLSRSTDGGKWIINTIGRIVEKGHNLLVVVLSNYNLSMTAGVTLVQRAADTEVDGLVSD